MANVKECVRLTALLLGLDDTLKDIDNPSNTDVVELMECVNLIVDEIACDYYPLVCKENVSIKNGKLLFSSLANQLVDVYSLKDSLDRTIQYKMYYDCLLCKDGEYVIEYSYCPPKLNITDKLPFFSYHISPRVIAYGVACEYCILHASRDEALLWDKRFREKLFLTTSKKKCVTVKPRLWR